jgi:hypothetical protein
MVVKKLTSYSIKVNNVTVIVGNGSRSKLFVKSLGFIVTCPFIILFDAHPVIPDILIIKIKLN